MTDKDKQKIEDLYNSFDELEQQKKEFSEHKNKKNKRNTLLIVFFGVIFSVLLVLGLMRLIKQNTVVETQKENIIVDDGIKLIELPTVNEEMPSKVPEWAKLFKPENPSDEEKAKISKTYYDLGLSSTTGHIPSYRDGYTNDAEKEFEDGFLPNPYFSEIIAEEWEYAITEAVTRIINPVFGEWSYLQLRGVADSADIVAPIKELFSDILSKNLLGKITSEESIRDNLKIRIDWEKNNFGKVIKESGIKYGWIGYVNDITMSPNEEMTGAKIESNVTYEININGNIKKEDKRVILDMIREEGKFVIDNIEIKEVQNEQNNE